MTILAFLTEISNQRVEHLIQTWLKKENHSHMIFKLKHKHKLNTNYYPRMKPSYEGQCLTSESQTLKNFYYSLIALRISDEGLQRRSEQG